MKPSPVRILPFAEGKASGRPVYREQRATMGRLARLRSWTRTSTRLRKCRRWRELKALSRYPRMPHELCLPCARKMSRNRTPTTFTRCMENHRKIRMVFPWYRQWRLAC